LSRRERLVLVVVFLATLPAVTTRIYSSDEVQYFSYLRSLWFDRDVSFENEYRHFYDAGVARSELFRETFLERATETGRRVNFGSIGCAILWAPFYAAGDVAARALRAAGHGVAADGYSRPYVAAVAYGSAFYAFAAVVISMLLARHVAGPSRWPALAVWAGTPLLFYMYVAPPFSHACSAFAVSAFVACWLIVRDRWTMPGVAALAAVGAVMAMVREQDALFAIGPAIDYGWTLRERVRRREPGAWRTAAAAAGVALPAFALVFVPQALAYLALNGRLGPSQLVTRKMTWTAPHAAEVLVSPEHGFLVWTPLAALCLAGLAALAARGEARARRIAWCALAMIALQVYVAGSVESWTVAGAFGQRRFVALTPLLTIGLAALAARARTPAPRRLLAAAIAVCVWWNVALIAQFATRMMDRQRLEPGRNAWTAFVVLPQRLPGLVYRYFADRASFYQQPL
jgi:hypothetical protein